MRRGLVSLADGTSRALAVLSRRLSRRRRAALAAGGGAARRHRGLESGLRGLRRLKARTDAELQALLDSIDAAAGPAGRGAGGTGQGKDGGGGGASE
jgi:hypothetical protein